MQVLLQNRPEEKRKLVAALESLARTNGLPAVAVQAADLALEEHLTNIMNYGYEDDRVHEIAVRLEVEPDCLLVEVMDDGKPFDPLQHPKVDTSTPLENKPVGGLGLHLIRRFMDELAYRREGGRNIFSMRKRLAQPPG